MKCSVYDDFRKSLFGKALARNPAFNDLTDLDKFVYIVNCQERDLADFVFLSWNRRRNYLYV